MGHKVLMVLFALSCFHQGAKGTEWKTHIVTIHRVVSLLAIDKVLHL